MTVDGTWTLTMDSPMGRREMKLVVTADGSTLTGTIDIGGGAVEITDGRVADSSVSWKAAFRGAAAQAAGTFAGVVDGDTMSGTVDLAGRGALAFSGTRSS